ncbi:MAG: hypothetical protein ACYDGM_11915 [Vulcanimicrobiaceae bacterium]
MTRRYGLANGIIVAAIVFALVACGTIQVASDALFAGAAQPGSLPTHVPLWVGLRVYRALDRIAPAPFVEASLARYELEVGNPTAAQRYAIHLPASPVRNDLLARVALARGQHELAFEYFFAAPDIVAVQREVSSIALRDPALAYAYEVRFKNRLVSLTTHPDAVADAYWRMGELATLQAYKLPPALRRPLFLRGLHDYQTALLLAPLNMKYVLANANQSLSLRDNPGAARMFRHGINIDPASADSLAGLGIVALREGHRALALAYVRRARAIDPKASELLGLERMLR